MAYAPLGAAPTAWCPRAGSRLRPATPLRRWWLGRALDRSAASRPAAGPSTQPHPAAPATRTREARQLSRRELPSSAWCPARSAPVPRCSEEARSRWFHECRAIKCNGRSSHSRQTANGGGLTHRHHCWRHASSPNPYSRPIVATWPDLSRAQARRPRSRRRMPAQSAATPNSPPSTRRPPPTMTGLDGSAPSRSGQLSSGHRAAHMIMK